jgi:hypothetical protein
MAYFVFLKNSDGIEGTLYRITENLSYLNIYQDDYKIIQDLSENFNAVKYGTKNAVSYSDNTINFIILNVSFNEKEQLIKYVNNFKNQIERFILNNKTHPLFNTWNDYYNQLSNLNLDNITYPLNKSLEQYFNDLNQPSLSPLQIP